MLVSPAHDASVGPIATEEFSVTLSRLAKQSIATKYPVFNKLPSPIALFSQVS